MIITCPSCATRYSLDDSKIPGDGRKVRCVQCSHVWHQDLSEPEDLLSLDEVDADIPEAEVPQLEDVSAALPTADEIDDIDAADKSGKLIIDELKQYVEDIEGIDPAAENPSLPREHTRRPNAVGLATLGILVAFVISALVFFRSELEKVWPPAQNLYATVDGWLQNKAPTEKAAGTGEPAPPSEHQNVSISIKTSKISVVNGERVLMIEGIITNAGDTVATVPNLRGSLKGSIGEILYSWDFSVPFLTIAAGTQQGFKTRVVDPPAGATIMNLDPITQN